MKNFKLDLTKMIEFANNYIQEIAYENGRFELKKCDDCYELSLYDDELLEKFECNLGFETSEEIVKTLISEIYDAKINPLKKFIKATKAFNSRKVKSLVSAYEYEDIDKISKLNLEMIERHKQNEKVKGEVRYWKVFTNTLFQAIDNFNMKNCEVV